MITTVEDPLNSLDTTKLEPGMIVKNYKALCALVGETPQSGNSKKAQLYNWSRFFSFAKQPHKNSYCIMDVYTDPVKNKRTKGKAPIYIRHIEAILLDYLSKRKDYSDSLTKKKWLYTLGMCNEQFLQADNADPFYPTIDHALTTILMNALRSLSNRNLIFYSKKIIICANNQHHEASPQETVQILQAESLYKHKTANEYHTLVKKYISERMHIDGYYRIIEITYNTDFIFNRLAPEELNRHKAELNSKIIDYLQTADCQPLVSELLSIYAPRQ